VWIPSAKRFVPIFVEYLSADLEEEVGTAWSPLHLLLLDHPLAHHLVLGREGRGWCRRSDRDPLDDVPRDLAPPPVVDPRGPRVGMARADGEPSEGGETAPGGPGLPVRLVIVRVP
jgi:hypothetical protein